MKQLIITRFLGSEHGTFGTLDVPGRSAWYSFFTLEEEWKNNQPSESCIPAGTYTLKKTVYFKRNIPTYEVMDVPGRSRILFHPGNTEEDTEGCVLLGMTLGVLAVRHDEETGRPNKKLAVLKSRIAFEKFMTWMGGDEEAELVVRWYGE
jgi:hypothetical protein